MKIQLTRDSKDDTILNQGKRLTWKNDQGYCNPTTRTRATTRVPEFISLKSTQEWLNFFHQQFFIESIPFEKVIPDKKDQTDKIIKISTVLKTN